MDMVSNEGFVNDPDKADQLYKEMALFMERKGILIIDDYDHNSGQFPTAAILPSLPHALIDTSKLNSIEDYLGNYKNLKKKLRVFQNKGGSFELIRHKMDLEEIESLKNCFDSTAKRSVIYLPYQDLNLNAAVITSQSAIEEAYYFIARLNGEFLGYQAAIKTGKHLNALHGAFDRTRKTTYHAYDILFVKMTEFAIENGLDLIDVGVVLNDTKKKMVNKTVDMSYYLFSKIKFVKWLFETILKISKVQGKRQMQYRT